MKRKTSIIISITGITIIALVLIGFTYGYYITQIVDNDKSTSVTVTTGNMIVKYHELSEKDTGRIIEPGYETIKTFAVQNIGNLGAYYSIYFNKISNSFNRVDDITFTLYRKSGYNTININDLSDCEVISTGVFPKKHYHGLQGDKDIYGFYLKTNEYLENENDYYTYAMKVVYENANVNQNEDQGKEFGGKVEIHGEIFNPYASGTLAYEIIKNSIKKPDEIPEEGHAVFTMPTITKPGKTASLENEATLSQANDDDGITYFYRGAVKNNYLSFNEMCWRIVRINGDGSIKLTLASAAGTCDKDGVLTDDSAFIGSADYGYNMDEESNIIADYDNSLNDASQKAILNTWYSNNLSNLESKLVSKSICMSDTDYKYVNNIPMSDYNGAFAYSNAYRLLDNYQNIANPSTLICNTNGIKSSSNYIYPLTIDEIVMSGLDRISSTTSYILDNATNNWHTISLAYGSNADDAFLVYTNQINSLTVTEGVISIRPAISLISGTQFNGGNGTKEYPYTIK